MTALLAEAGCENRAIMVVTGQGGDRQAGGAPETQGERLDAVVVVAEEGLEPPTRGL